MRVTRWLSVLVLSPLLGCAMLSGATLDKQLDTWLERQEYARALGALARVTPEQPNYEHLMSRQREILAKARSYEQKVVAESSQLATQGKWRAALDAYRDAMKRLPDSHVLEQGLKQLEARQQARRDELDTNLLIAQGEWLERNLAGREAIAQTDPYSSTAQHAVDGARREALDVADRLVSIGTQALKRGDLAVAERTLPLALRLDNNRPTQQANQALRERQEQSVQQARLEKKQQEQRDAKKLLAAFQQAYSDKNLVEARQLLDRLERMASPDVDCTRLRQQLSEAIAAESRLHLDKGMASYSQGQFEQAIASWRRVLAIDPENEQALAHLVRGEKVLDKLQQLRAKQN